VIIFTKITHESLEITHESLEITHESLEITHESLEITHEESVVIISHFISCRLLIVQLVFQDI